MSVSVSDPDPICNADPYPESLIFTQIYVIFSRVFCSNKRHKFPHVACTKQMKNADIFIGTSYCLNFVAVTPRIRDPDLDTKGSTFD